MEFKVQLLVTSQVKPWTETLWQVNPWTKTLALVFFLFYLSSSGKNISYQTLKMCMQEDFLSDSLMRNVGKNIKTSVNGWVKSFYDPVKIILLCILADSSQFVDKFRMSRAKKNYQLQTTKQILVSFIRNWPKQDSTLSG